VFQVQPVRWRGGRNLKIVSGVEEPADDTDVPLSGCGIKHRSHKKSNHVMQESIRRDDKGETAGAFDPFCTSDDTSVIVGLRCRALDGEPAKTPIADHHPCGVIEQRPIQWPVPRELATRAKGIFGVLVSANQIPV
jgi:hypothetical protein